jgi:hypothetical protein
MTEPNKDEGSDNEPQEQDAATEKRYRRKSVRRQLQSVIDELNKASKDPHQKAAKRVDALLRQSDLLLELQKMDAEDRASTLQDEHAALSAQHAADTQRVATLESELSTLRAHRCETTIRTVIDPEHKTVRAERDTLATAIQIISAQIDNKEVAAVRAIRDADPSVASLICGHLGINYREYLQYLTTYKTERDLLNVIEKAQVEDSPFLRFCRAALSVCHSLSLAAPRKSADAARENAEMTGEEKLRRAKLETGTLTPVEAVIGAFLPRVTQYDALRQRLTQMSS